ncbi:5'-nucleotidase C-terminal domain-containing protein [Mumia sp. zg.B53]|uniref:5'-nucleotidase C-terminal domain-containing protein n=1 Tax=Mumia sp. zg.B53 TaxID=2855449 RepID=UPI001C6DE31F|nr:5'-nucleotidase C-terminal domain-containing protein [Mumia sp. zg.B53]MBW9214594.1 5'-nucleotidase C-terminal domain-containing protein [Mumia sp. zg.B53]
MRPTHRTLLRRSTVFAATAALVAAPLSFAPSASAAPADEVKLTFLGINDFHGRIDSNTVKFAGTVEQLRAAAGEDSTVFVAAGDNFGASLFASAVDQDNPTIDVLKALQLDNSAVGNHEFDQGFADLTDRVVPRMGDNRFGTPVFLGANVYEKGTDDPALPEYAQYTVKGVDVAIVGVVTEETKSLVRPAGIADLEFGDPVEAVNRVAGELKDGNDANGEADVVIASYHEGAPLSEPAATLPQQVAASPVFAHLVNDTVAAVDAIFTGHTHQRYAYDAPIPGSTGTRPLVQSGNYGEGVAKVELTVDTATDDVTAYTRAVVARTTTADADLVAQYPRVAAVKTIVDAALARAAEVGNVRKATITDDITTALTGGTYQDGRYFHPTPTASGVRDDRGSESTLGGLVANALRERLGDDLGGNAEIGVVNPGGLRSDLMYAPDPTVPTDADGVVTYAQANAVLPFANNLWSVTLTGEQFVTMLEQQWQRDADGKVPSRSYLQLGLSDNVSYTFHEVDDPANPGAKKGVIDSVTIDGAPLDPTKNYRIGTFSFLATGGDNFRVFTEGEAPKDSGLVDRDAWIAYLEESSPLSPSFARRSVRQDGSIPSDLKIGDTVEIGLSGLDMTSLDSPQNTTVTARFGNTVVGTFPVVNGAADITLKVPATAGGARALTFTAAPSGTTVTFPVSVPKSASSLKAVVRGAEYGKGGAVQVTVTPPSATGTVTVKAGTKILGTGSVKNGKVTVPIKKKALRPGRHTLTVSYSGDSRTSASSTTVSISVAKAASATKAKKKTRTIRAKRTKAKVSVVVRTTTGVPANGKVVVTFKGNKVGTATVRNGRATITLKKFRSKGTKKLRITYRGSSTVKASSDTLTVTVKKRR